MLIQPSEARELCSKSEWELIETSFSPKLETLPQPALKSRLERARKLYRKTADLVSLQHSEPRIRTTRRKTEMLAAAIERFEAALHIVGDVQSVEPPPKDVHDKQLAEERRTLNIDALLDRADREFESRKSRVLSVQGVHGEQQGQKSGAKGTPRVMSAPLTADSKEDGTPRTAERKA